jgi:SAM-dependent methyltransferase
MRLDDRFDDLIGTLSGFHRVWIVYLGVELGLFARLRDAGGRGLTADELATASGCAPGPIEAWVAAADAHDIAEARDGRLILDEDTAVILLDEDRPEYLGGQFVHSVVASLDWSGMLDFFRTGEPLRSRPDRYRQSIERLTVQDIAVFFKEALAELPQLVAELGKGGRVADIHCGGGRWLIAMAQRFPKLELVGVELEEDSVARARAHVEAAGLADRIEIRHGDATSLGAAEFDVAYFQYALHQLADPVAALRSTAGALRDTGQILVLDWVLPSTPEELRTRQGELISGVQLDELYQGTALATRERVRSWFTDAGIGAPAVVDLPSGATLFVLER